MTRVKTNGKATDPFVEGIVHDVRFARADAMVMIGVPSHRWDDKQGKNVPLTDQARWANSAMELFADHFGGATALRSHKGIYKSTSGEYHWDDTILIQAFTSPDTLQEYQRVKDVVDFGRRMRIALQQEAVFVVFNNVVRFLKAKQ